MQGVIIFPALILMAGWSYSPLSSHPHAEDPRAFEKKENVRVTRDSGSQPLRRGRSVVPRVIRTGEKKLAKLNVRPCLGGLERIEGRHDKSPSSLPRPSFASTFHPGTDYLRLIIRAAAREVRIEVRARTWMEVKENPRSI